MSKTILITGASSGFGRGTAKTLFRAGHTVYASMPRARGKNREAAEALRKLGIKTVELDVSDDGSVEAGVKKVLAKAGKIDMLVNNAGIASVGVTEAFTAEQAKVIFDTNVIGPFGFACSQHAGLIGSAVTSGLRVPVGFALGGSVLSGLSCVLADGRQE